MSKVTIKTKPAKKTTKTALLIDPATQTITVIELEKGLQAIYKAMNCEMIEAPVEFPNGDTLYCDEESKLNRAKLIGGFTYGFPNYWCDIIMNKAIVIGTTSSGNDANCKSTPEYIAKLWGGIQWKTVPQCEALLDRMGF